MRCLLRLVLPCAALYLVCGAASAAAVLPPERLHFEHIGEQDAAGPPFDITAEQAGRAGATLVVVTPATYRALQALVQHAPTSGAPHAAGTFAVSEYQRGSLHRTAILRADVMRRVVGEVLRMHAAQGTSPPSLIAIQAELLRHQ